MSSVLNNTSFTTDGVKIYFPSAISGGSTTMGGIKKQQTRLPKVENKTTLPQFNSWMSVFLNHNSATLNRLDEYLLQKLLFDIESIFFFWVNGCKVRKERLDETKKRYRFFTIAQAELNTIIIGASPFTFYTHVPPIFGEDAIIPEPNLDWIQLSSASEAPPVVESRVVWQPMHSGVAIPTLEETLVQIAHDKNFVEGILPPEPISEFEF